MDKIYTDPNMENDNTEHIRGKRLSSILKAPRNPLDDLGSGNEITQDINIEKRRKNSRRVSFADTINCRVFQRDLKNNSAERDNTECAADTRNDVLRNQNEEPEAVPCEIAGMNTLLHAPIQASVQQTEWHDADNAIPRTNRHDTTLVFSDGNEMDMTASHTAVITRNLKNNQADKPEKMEKTDKIDLTSFLAGLNSSSGKADESREFRFFPDPTSHSCPSFEQEEEAATVKKINFNEFLMSLKSNEKALNPIEGPEKENVFFVPSQASEDVARSSVEFVYSHEPPDTCNYTKVFREQEDGMEMTRCQASGGKAVFPGVCKAPPEHSPCADVTQAFVDDGMDMTTSHTAKVSFPFSSLNCNKDFPSTDNSIANRASGQHFSAQQDPQLCTDRKAVNVEDRRDLTVLQTAKQEVRTTSAIPGSISSETVFRDDKTVVFSTCDDMEMTGNYTDVICNASAREMSSSQQETVEKPANTNSILAGNGRPAHGDRDMAKGLTSLDNGAPVAHGNSALEPSLGLDERVEKVTQGHGNASGNVGFRSRTNSVSAAVPKSRLQPSLANSLLASLPGEKTLMFSREDMDLTRTCLVKDDSKNVADEAAAGVFPSVTCRPPFPDHRAASPDSQEHEEMEITKCHADAIDGHSEGGAAEAKQMHCKINPRKNQNQGVSRGASSSDMDKENLEVIGTDGSFKRSQAMEIDTKEKHLTASVPHTNENMGVFADDQSMDITKTHPAACAAPVNRAQEYKNNQNNALSMQQQHQSFPFPVGSGAGTMSQTTATERGGLKMNTNKQTLTPLAPNGSGTKGNEQLGTVLGINAGCQNSDRQEKARTVELANKTLPARVGSERDFSIGKTEANFKNPPSVDVLCSRDAGEPLPAKVSEAHQSSQLPLFSEKSVVFPSGENMDLTGNCTGMAQSVLSGRKAGPGYLVQEENTIMSLKKGVTMAINSQGQPACDVYSVAHGKKMLPMAGFKHLPLAGEKTTIFSEDADMDITRSHTVSADNKIILQCKSSNDELPFISGDKTFTCNDDMEMSRLNTGVIDKSMAKAASHGVLNMAKRTGRKSLKGTMGEKTLLFSLGDENNDMEITESHTAAIGHEIISQSEGGLPSVSSAHPAKTLMFTGSQADTATTKSFSAGKIKVCDDGRNLEEQVVEERVEKVLREDAVRMAEQAGQEALPESRTVIFASDEDMEMTRTPAALLSSEITVQNRGSIPTISAVPADRTIVFTHSQDDMEVTASHTVAVNNNINGFENQEVAHKSTQQPDLRGVLLSSCRDEMDSPHTKDLTGDYGTKSQDKPSIPSSASSTSALPGQKGATRVPSGTTPDSLYPVSLPEETMDMRAPQDLDLPTDNSIPANSQQDLLPPENLKSKRVSVKPPSNGPTECSEESGNLVSHVSLPIQLPGSSTGSPDARSAQGSHMLEGDSSRREDLPMDLGLAGASLVPVSNKESKENEELSGDRETPPKDFEINSEQSEQLVVSASPRDQTDPTPPPELSGILNICSKLKSMRKFAVFSISETAFPDQLPKSSTQPEDSLRVGKNTVNELSNLLCTKEQENMCLKSRAAPVDVNSGMALKGKYQGINVPLGIFQPKLPNRRNPSVSSVQDTNVKPSDKGEAPVSEGNTNTGETPGNNKFNRQDFSPSQFIAEEFLPVCLEEMDSSGSVSSQLVENACSEVIKKQTFHDEKNQFDETKTCNNIKRALEQDEEDLQSPKKPKRDENLGGEASHNLQVTSGAVSQSQVEVREGEDAPNLLVKSPDCAHASTSSSLDSVKADTELTTQRSSQMESQLLTDSICEDNLREKFQSGLITVGEFFTLLEVHIPIQKPRHSHVPVNCAVSTPPTPEDLLYNQYIYRPKLRIYEEDCQALSQKIDELKVYANVQDQLLVNVNKSLWEVMRTCSDEELKNFGAELNKMKSYFTKESKILAHDEKAALYSKLLESAQEQHRKLQSRTDKLEALVKEAESCLAALGADCDWEEWEADGSDEVTEGKNLQEELESLKAQEERLQRELSDLEAENEQMLAQMNLLKEKEKSCQELLEEYNFTEWEITEWSQQQAVFNFLYDAVELTVVFGPPVDGDVFGEDPSRKIVSLNFESLLDEEKAPPSSCLVQRLIFQFIESQGCWQEKCPTLCYLPQVLHDVSLVVNHCKILGEEIEFLERWGGKFNLLKADISDTKVKLLFSASTVFAKFEVTLSLSASYPSASLPFTVHKQIGNIGEEEISAVLSRVPTGYHYLRRMVSSIHQDLLRDPR
ncbi:outer kinetochore KNL1 complex subunit KNL1 [Aegotheles albertisi]